MRRVILTTCSVLLCYTLHAQAYFSEQPIDAGSYNLPEQYIGTWKEEKKNQSGRVIRIMADVNKTGQINVVEGLGNMAPALLSMVNDNLYLNLFDDGSKDQPNGYFIYHLVLSPNNVRLTPLKDELPVPAGKTLYEFLQQPDIDIKQITTGRSIWLRQTGTPPGTPLDTTGRQINIRHK